MFKKFLFTSFLVLSSLITIYPSKKENTYFLDYCYSLEKVMTGELDISSSKLCSFLKESISKERRGPMPVVNL